MASLNEDSLDLLTAYAVEARCPGVQPTIEESKRAIQIIRIMRRFMKKALSI